MFLRKCIKADSFTSAFSTENEQKKTDYLSQSTIIRFWHINTFHFPDDSKLFPFLETNIYL